METKSRKIIGAAAGATLVLGSLGTAYASPVGSTEASDNNTAPIEAQFFGSIVENLVQESEVGGEFTYSQANLVSADDLKKCFQGVSAALCNSVLHKEGALAEAPVDALDWKFSIFGDVKNPYSATIGDFVSEEDGAQTTVMGCACMANPADGRAIANAEVTGLDLLDLVIASGPSSNANAITFTSSDGYNQTLPLYYLFTHSSVLAYEVAGESVSESMGGTVQVWIHGLAANYYVADVVSIEISALEETPVDPSESDSFANSPNVTVLSAA